MSLEEEQRKTLRLTRYLLYVVFVVLGFLVVKTLGSLLAPVLAAAGLAYMLDGLVDRLERRGIRRAIGAALMIGGMVVTTALVIALVYPLLSRDIKSFANELPDMLDRVTVWAKQQFNVEIPATWRQAVTDGNVQGFLSSAVGPIGDIAKQALAGVLHFLGFLAEFLLVPVFAYYFLVDWDHMTARFMTLIPLRYTESVVGVARDIDNAISVWIRGQLIVTMILAILYAVAFRIIGLHLGIMVGVTVGCLTIIPFVGTLFGALIATAMLLLDWQGFGPVAAVGGVFVALHLLEAAYLTPKLVGKKIGLGDVGALLAVVAGGKLLGFTGVLLAVPMAASVAVLMRRATGMYRQTSFYVTPKVRPETDSG